MKNKPPPPGKDEAVGRTNDRYADSGVLLRHGAARGAAIRARVPLRVGALCEERWKLKRGIRMWWREDL